MQSILSTTSPALLAASQPQLAPTLPKAGEDDSKLRGAFDSFVGETFFSQMLSSMRKSVGKPAYFYGGRAEEIFQGQLDQVMAEEMSKSSAETFTGPMFKLFSLNRA